MLWIDASHWLRLGWEFVQTGGAFKPSARHSCPPSLGHAHLVLSFVVSALPNIRAIQRKTVAHKQFSKIPPATEKVVAVPAACWAAREGHPPTYIFVSIWICFGNMSVEARELFD
ncbi:hypothetical protein [Bradyrhizobium sp. USDA 4473]